MSLSNVFVFLVLLQLLTVTMASRNLANDKVSERNISSTSCKIVQFDELKLADMLQLMRESAVNTIGITVTVASANQTRVFPEMKWLWANEIGRTLMSLISRANTMFASPIYTFPLEVGMKTVSTEVTEEPTGCLPSGREGFDLIFDFLLNELFTHMSDKDKDRYYKLCRPHDIEGPVQFKCCEKIGDRKLTICADYSSIVLQWAVPGLIAAVAIFCPMILPFLLEHIITCQEKIFYETSFSHMSLTSIVSMIFFEGHGQTKSLFRRGAFVGLTLVILLLTDFLGIWKLKILFCVWAFFFCFFDFDRTDKKIEPRFVEKLISCFSKPFFVPFDYVRSHCNSSAMPLQCAGLRRKYSYCRNFLNIFNSSFVCLLTLFYFLLLFPLLVAVHLAKFVIFDFMLRFVSLRCCRSSKVFKKLFTIVRLLTLAAIIFVTVSLLIFVISIIVGVILNGEFFNPFIAPVVTLLVFFWKNWKFSVEAQCLLLKTLIIDVCKEKNRSVGADEGNNNAPKPNDGKTSSDNEATSNIAFYVLNEVNHGRNNHTWGGRSNITTSNTARESNHGENGQPNESTGKRNKEDINSKNPTASRTTRYVSIECNHVENDEADKNICKKDNGKTTSCNQTTLNTAGHVSVESNDGENSGADRGAGESNNEETRSNYSTTLNTGCHISNEINHGENSCTRGARSINTTTSNTACAKNHGENCRPDESNVERNNDKAYSKNDAASRTTWYVYLESNHTENSGADKGICEPDNRKTSSCNQTTLDTAGHVSIESNDGESSGGDRGTGESTNEETRSNYPTTLNTSINGSTRGNGECHGADTYNSISQEMVTRDVADRENPSKNPGACFGGLKLSNFLTWRKYFCCERMLYRRSGKW